MNVYLAGKMDEKHGAWRDAVMRWPAWRRRVSASRRLDFEARGGVPKWETTRKVVLGLHDYVGPYAIEGDPHDGAYDYRVFHGSELEAEQHGCIAEGAKEAVVEEVQQSIFRADIVFAYINAPDAYGTIAEIGFAKALGKFVTGLIQPGTEFDPGDFWFVKNLCTYWQPYPTDLLRNAAKVKLVPKDEDEAVHEALTHAFVAYAAWREEQARYPARITEGATQSTVFESFQKIARWTSDPRVRDEAQQMLKVLSGGAR